MKLLLPVLLAFAALTSAFATSKLAPEKPFGLVIHGGAGVIKRDEMTPELEAQYREKLNEALHTGYSILLNGGAALDAVTAVINILEDSPLFNAGKGAVLNADGICELDASIMNGKTLAAGAIAGVHHIKNPINLARDVMEKSQHVMLVGDGAEQFAKGLGYEMVPNEYFQTEFRRKQLEKAQEKERADAQKAPKSATIDHSGPTFTATDDDYLVHQQKYGTVGCTALDQQGNLAAGTSTGGMTNKKYGRVGDAPIIGAGTYANNATCAISATGWGEFFIRANVAHDISARMEYKGQNLPEAATAALEAVARLGGDGGVIGIDRQGNVTMEFNSPGMYRAYRVTGKKPVIAIYGDEARR